MSRREFLRLSAGAAAALPTTSALLAACGGRPGTSTGTNAPFQLARQDHPVTLSIFDDNQAIKSDLQPEKNATLQIYNWDVYIWKKVVKAFCDKYNCDFEITTFNNMDEALSKIRTNQFNFDVFFPTIDVMGKLVAAKILQPLNHDYIPNLAANCWPVFKNPFYDQGWHYSVPYTVYTTGIEYRRDFIADDVVAGMDNPYEIFWDPKYMGKVGIYDDYREAMSMVLLKNGITDLNTSSVSDINMVKQDLLDMIDAVNVRTTTNGAYQKLPEGEFYVHQAWSGDAASAWFDVPHYTTKDFKTIGYWYPKDRKGAIGNDLIAIPSRSKNPVLAHLFLNHMLDFKNSMDNFSWVGYQPPQVKADPGRLTTTKSAEGEPYVFPWLVDAVVRQSDFETGYEELELSPSVDNRWHNAWEEFKTGAKA
ncbi:MAG: extracellular solute-binding protein [Actinomycetota bacterium]|nr:extracellular solute-binding protein [Actinomycetota bacterium]